MLEEAFLQLTFIIPLLHESLEPLHRAAQPIYSLPGSAHIRPVHQMAHTWVAHHLHHTFPLP